MSQQDKPPYPILENEELLACLEEMEVPLDPAQLVKPTYEAIKPLFEQIVVLLTGVTREEIIQPVFTAMDTIEFPELHDESIPCFNFFKHLSKLLFVCDVRDFSWKDIFKPEPARLRKLLSAVINFAKFREEKVQAFQEMQNHLDSLVVSTRSIEEEYKRNMSALKALQQERSVQMAEAAAVEAEDQEVCRRNTALNKQATALQAEVRDLKQQLNSLADAASQAKFDLATLKQETEQLQDQVVQSPEKHRSAIAELGAAAEAKRLHYAALNSASIDNDRKLEAISKLSKEVARCTKLAEELEAVVARKKETSSQVKDCREAIATEERRLLEVTNTNHTLRRQQAATADKFARLEGQAQLKMEAAVSCVEEQVRARQAVEAENAAIAAKAAEDELAVRSVRERMAELAAAHDSTVRGVMDKFAVLRRAVSDYNRRLEAAMEAASAGGQHQQYHQGQGQHMMVA